MASGGLGDYIHYSAKNYYKYGTQYPKVGRENINSREILSTHKNILSHYKKTTENIAEAQKLAEYLNVYFNFSKSGGGNTQQFLDILGITSQVSLDECKEILIKILNQKVQEINPEISVDWNTLSAWGTNAGKWAQEEIQTEAMRQYPGDIGKGNTGESRIDAVVRRYNFFRETYQNLQNQMNNGKTIGTVESGFMQQFEQLDNAYRALLLSLNPESQGKFHDKNIIEMLNNMGQHFKGAAVKEALGLLGEAVPTLFRYIAQNINNLRGKSIDELTAIFDSIKERDLGIVGGQRSMKVTDISKMAVGYSTDKQGEEAGSYLKSIGGNKVSISKTQDKIDVQVFVPSLKSTLPISVKNVASLSDVHILKGADLTKILQDYVEFGNHYLNLTAKHQDIGWINLNYAKLASQLLYATVGLKALEGGIASLDASGNLSTGSNTAKYLVVNDRTGGGAGYKVFSISSIINRIADNIDNAKNIIKISWKGADLTENSNNIWQNNEEGSYKENPNAHDAYRRISKLMAQVSAVKYNVQIDLTNMKYI